MKYVLMFIDTAETKGRSPEEAGRLYQQVQAWWGEHAAAGTITGGKQLKGPETATTVRHDGGKVTIVDGPFIEAKESIGGYGELEVENLDAALALARSWPWGGVVEVRPALNEADM